MIYRLIIFLILNFGALSIGGLFTDVKSDWYENLNHAPWIPPGWVFGAAWTTIMICFSLYMSILWKRVSRKNILIALYAIQLILNIGWNPTFFYFHNVSFGFFIIVALTLLIILMFFAYRNKIQSISYLILPYALWLLIATSLNGYVLFNN